MSNITVITDSQQSELVTNGLAKNGELYLKADGSTDAGSIVVYDSGSWRTFANEYAPAGFSNNYSLQFDGTDDSANTTLGSQIFNGDFGLSFWIKPTRAGSNTILVHLGSSSSYSDGFRLYQQSSGFTLWNGLGGYNNVFGGTIGSVTLNAWQNIIVTRSGSSMTFYINGSSVGTGTNSSAYTNTALTIAYNQYTRYQGLIDEVSLFNSALSSSDATAIYNSGVPGDLSSLSPAAWWKMGDSDGGSGSTISDEVASADLTLVNGPTFSTDVPS